jgi:hypothetical protein
VTVTPPSEFVGWLAIRVSVQQTTPAPNANDAVDAQVIRVRVLPAGTSSALASGDDDGGVDEDAVDEVFEQLGAM